jgi:uncharacterized phage-associated protein
MTKILKLISYFEYKHFELFGTLPIGLNYHAWKEGPVPKSLYVELNKAKLPKEFREKFHLEINKKNNWRKIVLNDGVIPDMSFFEEHEIEILNRYAKRFYETTSEEICNESHKDIKPWRTAWDREKNSEISFMEIFKDASGSEKAYLNENLVESRNLYCQV